MQEHNKEAYHKSDIIIFLFIYLLKKILHENVKISTQTYVCLRNQTTATKDRLMQCSKYGLTIIQMKNAPF